MDEKLTNSLPGNTDDERIIGMIKANYSESESYLRSSGYYDEWKEYNDLYRCIPNKKPYTWMSNKFIPIVMSKIDSFLSNLMGILFQVKPPIEVVPKAYGNGDAYHAGIIKTLLAKQTMTDGFYMKMVAYLKNLGIYGTSIGITSWERKQKIVTRKVKAFERVVDYFGTDITDMIPATRKLFKGYDKQENVVEDESPAFEPANIADIFPDPQAIEINDSWVIWRTRKSIAYLRENMKSKENPNGVYNKEVMKLRKVDSYENKVAKSQIEGNMNRLTEQPVTRQDLNTIVEVIYWFGLYDMDGDGKPERCIYVLAGDKYLIGKDSNTFWHRENPLVKCGYDIIPNEFYHVGIAEQLMDLQHNINETVNQRIDNITLILNPMMQVNRNAGIMVKDIVIAPGKPIMMDESGGVTFDRPADVTQSNFVHVADLERWAQEVSVPKITQGIGGSGQNNTATGMSILAEGAQDKTMLIAKIVENQAFNKILQQFYEMDYQFLDEYKIAKLLNMDAQKIDMDKMRPEDYDICASGVRVVGDRNQKVLKVMQAMNIFKGQPWFKEERAGQMVIELMAVTDNPEDLIRSKEEVAAMVAEQKKEAIAQQMVMAVMNAKMKPQGPGREAGQFGGGETNMPSAGGVPPNTVPVAPGTELGAP